MPRGLDFGKRFDEVEALGRVGGVVGDRVALDALDVDGGVLADGFGEGGVAAGVGNGLDVHVASEVRDELVLAARDQVGDSGGQVGGGEDLGELEGCEGIFLREKNDGRVAGNEDGRQVRDETEEVRLFG